MSLDFLKKAPFYLDDNNLEWVQETLNALSVEEKAGQLFCICAAEGTQEEVDQIFKVLKPGGIMYRPFSTEEAVSITEMLYKKSDIPMLIAANLEKGGNGIVTEGTLIGSPLEVAATNDVKMAEKLALTCGREGKAVGANWAFAPIIDIDNNFRNPITNIRTFGSDWEKVRDMGLAYVKNIQALGLAASIKHFPGDGMDERDQHLVSSVNTTTCEEWDKTYGAIYKTCIDAGAMTVMVGHILHPEYSKKLNPSLKDDEILPASLSRELMMGLLRKKLGFNGLICTDATTMAGFTIPMERRRAVPYSIAVGADVFLFTRNLEEDYAFMLEGINDGTITPERLDEAVARILGLKAALGLHKKPTLPTLENARSVIGCDEHKAWARECAEKAITLVKEQKDVLPLDTNKYKKILYYPIESEQGVAYSVRAGVCDQIRERLIAEGFKVDVFVPHKAIEGMVPPSSVVTENYDLILYLANISTKSNQTTVRIEWQQPMGANCPHFIQSVPTVFVSVENPYHLLDVPRIKTFINCYNSNDTVLESLMDKLMGRSKFVGTNPIDPFCGRWDTRL